MTLHSRFRIAFDAGVAPLSPCLLSGVSEIHFRLKSISLSLNAEVDDSLKSIAHLLIVKELAGQLWLTSR